MMENFGTRNKRTKKYMEILARFDEANTAWNWDVLDTLTDDELFNDENKVKEKIDIIQNHRIRIENNFSIYTENIMECVRQRWGLEKYDDSKDDLINELSPDEVFEHVCNWNCLLGYASMIKSWINDIYKIDLDAITKKTE